MTGPRENEVRLRVHLSSPPERVYEFLATNAGRSAFWADTANERDGVVSFEFSNGMRHEGPVVASEPGRLYAVEYFGGSEARFELTADGAGGTDVTLRERRIPAEWLHEHRAGWVSVLLALKAAVDFSIDLRNQDPDRNWESGYVDV